MLEKFDEVPHVALNKKKAGNLCPSYDYYSVVVSYSVKFNQQIYFILINFTFFNTKTL